MSKPFDGVKIVGLTYAGTANMAMRVFGMYGACVIRIESETRPCNLRIGAPFRDNKPGINRSGYYAMFNNDRYSLALDLKHPKSKAVLEKLIRWADVFVENFAPGTVERLGFGYEKVRELKPDIIYLSISSQGQTGPHYFMPSYGPQLQALTGHVNMCGWADRGPCQIDQSYPDFIVPSYAVIGTIGALMHKRKTGEGQFIDASNLEPGVSWIAPVLLDYTANKRVQSRNGNSSPSAAPHNAYRCKGDDSWCAIAITNEEEWRSLCVIMGNPESLSQKKFSTFLGRKENEAELDSILETWTNQFDAEDLMQRLQSAGVPAGRVETCKDIVDDPQLRYRNYFISKEHGEIGEYEVLNTAYVLSRTPSEVRLPYPCLGEHSEYVLKEILNYSDEEFIELMVDDVLR